MLKRIMSNIRYKDFTIEMASVEEKWVTFFEVQIERNLHIQYPWSQVGLLFCVFSEFSIFYITSDLLKKCLRKE